jgi:hypothetical protein
MLIEIVARRRSLAWRTDKQRALDRRRECYQIAGDESSFLRSVLR